MIARLQILLAFLLPASLHALTFEDDDLVVLLGNTVIERAQQFGYFETALTLSTEKENLRFRNLAWSGDTVFGHARSYFGPPEEGCARLGADLKDLQPQVVILCYGSMAAFEGEKGLPDFIAGYERLLTLIKETANPREIVIVSPPPAELVEPPLPDLSEQNQRLKDYREALAKMAKAQELIFADFHTEIGTVAEGLTTNGLHFTEQGYRTIAPAFVRSLGLTPPSDSQLESAQGQQLRQAIVEKNKLFFHRWRPANETYLRLFRKHEQGQNVKELPLFDPIIAEKEALIRTLKKAAASAP